LGKIDPWMASWAVMKSPVQRNVCHNIAINVHQINVCSTVTALKRNPKLNPQREIIKRAIATPLMAIPEEIKGLELSKDELNRVSSVIKK